MNNYLSNEIIENIFKVMNDYLLNPDSSFTGFFSEVLRNNIEICFSNLSSEELYYDELGLIDLERSLERIKDYYCNSFIEDNHIELLIFVSDVVHELNQNEMFTQFSSSFNEEINKLNFCVSKINNCAFIGEFIDEFEGEIITLNILRMYKSFNDVKRIEMVQERIKDAIFLYKNNRYTGCFALVAFALEGFLRGIFSDNYDENEEQYNSINARLGKSNDNLHLTLNYHERIKPTIDLHTYIFDPSKRIDIHIRKIREKNTSSIIEMKIKDEYAGLICSTEKQLVRTTKQYNLEKLIEKAKTDNLIDNEVFLFESFDFLRKVRNNIVHFDQSHQEITQQLKAKKVLFKIIEFINTKLYFT